MLILGLSGGPNLLSQSRNGVFGQDWGHDAAAVLIHDGKVVAAVEEERLNRIKHTNNAPIGAIRFCLERYGVHLHDLDRIVYPAKEEIIDPVVKQAFWLSSEESIIRARDLIHQMLQKGLGGDIDDQQLVFVPHHIAHAASAYYHSGHTDSLVLTMDGGGDDLAGAVYSMRGDSWETLAETAISDSLGLFYLAVTQFLGYRLFDEYKIMGLAPYGNAKRYAEIFRSLYTLLPDGVFHIDPNLIDRICTVGPRRWKHEAVTQFHQDIAAALQQALEDIVHHVVSHYQRQTNQTNLCLAGGVAHNCTVNGKLLSMGLFQNVFVQPASHDAGLALGAALYTFHKERAKISRPYTPSPCLEHVYWGTDIGTREAVSDTLKPWNDFIECEYYSTIASHTAQLLANGAIIGWVQGRSEFGPRALGNRSIIADPRPAKHMALINMMVKKREAYRPFAPAVLEEYAHDYFELPSTHPRFPFMTFVVNVRKEKHALLGATTHVDGTARVQTVSRQTNPRFWELINSFRECTGVPVLLNTSFNNNVEPIVDSVNDAIVCFLTTGLDYLVVGDYLIKKKQVDDTQYGKLIPSLPRYVTLTQTKACVANGHMAVCWELVTPTLRTPVSIAPEVFALLLEADGYRTLAQLLQACHISSEQTSDMVKTITDLWSQRVVWLRPS